MADRHPIPALWFCLNDLNHVLIVLNSSLNFYIYCVVGKRFRDELFHYLRYCIGKVRSLVTGRSTMAGVRV